MPDLRKRFGMLVAAHRKRRQMTQEALAQAADLSVDMVRRIEAGVTGARFPTIERLAQALHVDPAELFTTQYADTADVRGDLIDLSSRLSLLSDKDLAWLVAVIEAALRPRAGGN